MNRKHIKTESNYNQDLVRLEIIYEAKRKTEQIGELVLLGMLIE